jgi:uncharacterized protein YjbJ (UPF0337 family)
MDWNRVEGNWKQMKGKVKEQWGKLTDDDLDVIAGKQDQLEGRLQQRYGYAKDQAQKEINDWYGRQSWWSAIGALRKQGSFCLKTTTTGTILEGSMASPSVEEIRAKAYQLWNDADEPEGQSDAFWYQAEKELLRKWTEPGELPPGMTDNLPIWYVRLIRGRPATEAFEVD